ncbi:MAG TPA: RbsD/FucU domain-containing protein, partial [Xanthobacteraceae bacterium]|nr:RbsD/FucU domain-containing protein [Xanthobacteraceae bacterium]
RALVSGMPVNVPLGSGGYHVLKNLSPLLNADLLHALASMGHGDELAIVDAHFPAASMARRLVRIDGASAPQVLAACLSLMPLDTFVECPANRMELVHAPDEVPEVAHDFQRAIDAAEARHLPLGKIERHAFYKRAQQAYAIVATGERRPYGCILITKGVVL